MSPATNTIEDRLAIIELLNRLEMALDFGEADAYADGFAPDGRIDAASHQAEGRQALKAMISRMHASGFLPSKRQYLGPIKVDVDGDEAHAVSSWWIADAGWVGGIGGSPAVWATGTYNDRLKRIDGEWKIVHRIHKPD
ncbi:MAG: nuclear transport factor 2 family protein [Rubrobacteraceae bacterium]